MATKFSIVLWDYKPSEYDTLKNGGVRVNLNIEQVSVSDDNGGISTKWRSRSCEMSATEFAAYIGAQAAAVKRENAIIDEYTEQLIKGGII